ncbi:mammalian cell entry protein [Mycobacterium sp. Root265]|uniref:mammalian cell entry protein n=1 Tax=Mycobacterium sp. Root265 TaxID=1736504 RepID=UPI0012E349B0|nr:mammalian cell entry protein [Mycobacterium sp. Root265]
MVAPDSRETASTQDDDEPPRSRRWLPRPSRLLYAAIILALAALCGFLAVGGYEGGQELRRQESFLAAARAGSEMLTTVDAAHVHDDVARITASSTGPFLEDFQRRSEAFVEAVTKAQSSTRGTVLEAGLEQIRGDQADVLVTVAVTTSINGAEAQPRQWRMRIGVQQDGSTAKVSNVEFVP